MIDSLSGKTFNEDTRSKIPARLYSNENFPLPVVTALRGPDTVSSPHTTQAKPTMRFPTTQCFITRAQTSVPLSPIIARISSNCTAYKQIAQG